MLAAILESLNLMMYMGLVYCLVRLVQIPFQERTFPVPDGLRWAVVVVMSGFGLVVLFTLAMKHYVSKITF